MSAIPAVESEAVGHQFGAFVPGEAFGTPGYARFSFAMADADMEEGIRRIHQWVTA